MTEEIIYTVDITAWNGSTTTTLRYATSGCVITGNYYEPRIKQPGNMVINMFSSGKTSGQSVLGYGEVVLINNDGGLDSMLDYGFDGRSIVFGKYLAIAAVYTLLTSCTMEQATFTANDVQIRVKDPQAALNVAIQPTKYGGTNTLPAGIDGTDDIKGKPLPLTYGTVYNVTPVLVNTSRLIYQVHTATVTIPAVYDKGVLLTAGAAYSSESDMQNNPPDPGYYRVWGAGGCFRLGSAPVGQVTADVVEGSQAADRTAAQIAKRIALRVLASGDIISSDITALDTANSSETGIYISEESTIIAALDEVLGSVGAWYGFDKNADLRMAQFTAPSGTADSELTEYDYLSLERIASSNSGRGVPPYKVNLNYRKNYTVQNKDQLAGGVPYVSDIWVQRTLPASANWKSITYGNGLFVAVASASSIAATSPDGITWTQRTLPASNAWTAIAYGNGTFIALSALSSVTATSPDGVTWIEVAIPTSINWAAITYGEGTFVITGSGISSISATSPDGITWTKRVLPASYSWSSVVYGNGSFLTLAFGSPIAGTLGLIPKPLNQYQTVTVSDSAILTAHPLAPELNINTLLIDPIAASTESTRLLNLYKVRRDTLEVQIPSANIPYLELGKIVKITSTRYGYAAGKLFRVIGVSVDWQSGITTLTLWG